MFRPVTLAAALTLAAFAPAQAASPRDSLVVAPAWLASHTGDADLVILHVGSQRDYDAGHIAGARLVTLPAISAPQASGGLSLEMSTPDLLRTQLQALGISDTSRIVVYPIRDLQSATRVILTLDAAGLGARTSLLDGGLNAWTKAGKPTSTEATPAKTGLLSPLKMKAQVVDAAFITDHLKTPGYTVVDARAPAFYSGAQAGGNGNQPKGHVQGAKSVPFSSVTNADLTLKSEAELKAIFKDAGIGAGDTVVSYCHVGQQATAVWFAARTLGINVMVYDGSYEDWAKRGLPVDGPAPAAT